MVEWLDYPKGESFHPPREWKVTIAHRLTEAGMTRKLADATADAICEAAEHGDHVTPETLRAELAGLKSRLYRAMLVQADAIVGALVSIAGPQLVVCR